MLINVMANNVMLSKNIQRSKLLIHNLKALNITDYCFELSPHDFGGPPPLYVQQHQLEETNEKTTIQQNIGRQQLQQDQNKKQFNTTATNTSITITKNDDNS
ncbi:hypothetical protein FF38_13872 [Lucilia cuprina]|uniref:Uncharacterized protein n=1 Tax=Lucilia cuprina TaxID=7375 RepID=A0A0L0BZW4_LUCCU|nr:hypothetical protein FF38_13872 [Lucilia cuprina]